MKKELGQDVDVELRAGSNGVFDITIDGKTVFSKNQRGRFPDDGEIVGLIGKGAEL